MKLNGHPKGINDEVSWKACKPPKKGDMQWRDGRSAKEFAKYMTEQYPLVPVEIENVIKALVSDDTKFDWDAEYVTTLPGKGEGRNHDGILYNNQILVTIEAKTDETFGKLIEDEIKNASVNKLNRIAKMLDLLFKGGFNNYKKLRYQLLTAAVGTILEAKNKNLDTAVLLIIVFKTNGDVEENRVQSNHQDVDNFLRAVNAYDENGFKVIPNSTGIKLYFQEIIL